MLACCQRFSVTFCRHMIFWISWLRSFWIAHSIRIPKQLLIYSTDALTCYRRKVNKITLFEILNIMSECKFTNYLLDFCYNRSSISDSRMVFAFSYKLFTTYKHLWVYLAVVLPSCECHKKWMAQGYISILAQSLLFIRDNWPSDLLHVCYWIP